PTHARTAAELKRNYSLYLEARDALRRRFPQSNEFLKLLAQLDDNLRLDNPGPVEEGLVGYEQHVHEDLKHQLGFLQSQRSEVPEVLPLLPEALKARTLAKSGRICLRVFPSQDCWEREALERFVMDLKKVDPHVTGNPVLIYTYLEDMRIAYNQSA